ncbi:MAG: hypothetical protein ACTHY5_03380 [Oceanisphaera sp.]
MKTNELLKLSDADMVSSIKKMKLKECEKHTRNYSKRLNLDFDKLIISGTNAVFFDSDERHVSLRVHSAIVQFCDSVGCYSEKEVEIMSALVLMMIHKRTNGFDMASTLSSLSKS